MFDEMDRYFSTCIKNWTTRQPLPLNGKSELLVSASQTPGSIPAPYLRFVSSIINRWSSSGDLRYHHLREEYDHSQTQSIRWSLRLMINTRLAF